MPEVKEFGPKVTPACTLPVRHLDLKSQEPETIDHGMGTTTHEPAHQYWTHRSR
jgi:hypothetical protein